VTVRRSRTVGSPPETVWAVVGDPHHLPRWWPRVERVESVDADAWTTVMRSPRGHVVRADYRLVETERGRRREWAQQLAGTPFERLLREHRTAVELAGAGERATEVTLTVVSRGRGTARLGGFMMRRAQRRQLDEALDALAEVVAA
jgi:uncharacterized protein YndB with AHSA1/START domain